MDGTKPKRSQAVMLVVSYVMLAVFVILAAILGIRLALLGALPTVFLVVYAVVVVVIALVVWLSRKKKGINIVFAILALLLSAAMLYALSAINKVDRAVRDITISGTEVSQISVLVLADDPAETPADLQGYDIGYAATSSSEVVNQVMEAIAQNGGAGNEYVPYGDVIGAANALLSGSADAVFFDSSYIDIIDELEGYEGFSDSIRVIFTLDVTEEAPNDQNSQEPVDDLSELLAGSGLDSFVVYISGIDTYGSVNTKSRSDVNILAVVNTTTHQVQLINTPRDYYVPLPISNGVRDKLTHAGIYGINTSMGALEMLYGVKIDYYIRLNFTGFVDIIDTLGGIDVYSEYDFTSASTSTHFSAGMNHLTGSQALAFARERHSFATGDVQRGKNQMAVITAMINGLTSADVLYNYSSILDSISDCFQTNFTADEIYTLVRMQLQSGQGWDVESYTVTGSGSSATTYSMPSMKAYVMIPNDSDVATAQSKIAAVLNGN